MLVQCVVSGLYRVAGEVVYASRLALGGYFCSCPLLTECEHCKAVEQYQDAA